MIRKMTPLLLLLTMNSALILGCTPALPEGKEPTLFPVTASVTPLNPTETAIPSPTIIPPTQTPFPPTTTPLPATHTVCRNMCNYTTVQAAVDGVGSAEGVIIEITDPIHTESGIVINKDLTIRGQGADATVIQGHEKMGEASNRIFLIEEEASVIFEKMTIRHGYVIHDEGGGIANHGNLTLKKVNITDNIAGNAGGIFNTGKLTIIQSTIKDNTTEDDWVPDMLSCGSGGGIRCARGSMFISNSTISGNRAGMESTGTGGGLRVGCKCKAEIINSTISGNRSTQYGGGLVVKGEVKLTNCTISGNVSATEAGGVYVGTGGILDLENSIIANNSGSKGNCYVAEIDEFGSVGTLNTSLNNLVEGGGCEADYEDDPILGPLANNGGDTWTHSLQTGSPAIDAILPSECSRDLDQRGMPRPIVQTSAETACDIGSYELQPE